MTFASLFTLTTIAVTYILYLIPRPVNNTLHPDFSSCPSETLYSTHPPTTISYKNKPIFVQKSPQTTPQLPPHNNQNPFTTPHADYIHMPDYPENPIPLPAPDLKNKSGGGKGSLRRPDFHSNDTEHVTHLQKMPVTPGCDTSIYGPDKDGVDWAFGSFDETAVNDLQEKNRDRKEPISHLGV